MADSQERVKARARVLVKPVVKMGQVKRLIDVPYDATIVYETVADLEKYIKLAAAEGGHSRAEVLDQFENFIWGLDEKRAALNNSTWSMNHGEGATETVIFTFQTLEDGREALVGEAYVDLPKGAELFNNYRDFIMPRWYTAWTRKQKIVDVRTLVLRIVDGGGHKDDPPKLPDGKVGFGEPAAKKTSGAAKPAAKEKSGAAKPAATIKKKPAAKKK
jgi:hypothetical protein